MRVKDLLLEALSRANHIEDGSPADSRELAKARKHFNSSLSTYSDSNLITAFQKVVTITGKEEQVLGKYNLKRGKNMYEVDDWSELPDAARCTLGNDFGHLKGTTTYAYLMYTGPDTWSWTFQTYASDQQALLTLDCCDYVPDVIVEDIERIVAALEKRKDVDGPFAELNFTPLSTFYSNDAWDIYCAVPNGDNKVKLYLPKELVGREVRIVYNTSMKFKDNDYLELPEVYRELLTLSTTVGLLMEDADSDPTQLNNFNAMLVKLENQIAANNANTRRIVRKTEKVIRPLYTGAFIYGRFSR